MQDWPSGKQGLHFDRAEAPREELVAVLRLGPSVASCIVMASPKKKPHEPQRRPYFLFAGVILAAFVSVLVVAWRATETPLPLGPAEASPISAAEEDGLDEASRARMERDLIARAPVAKRPPLERPVPSAEARPSTPAFLPSDLSALVPTAPRGPSLQDELEARFADEEVDPAWASDRENELTEALGYGFAAEMLRRAQCRSSICVVEIERPSPEDFDRLSSEVMRKPAFADRPSHLHMNPKTGRITMFIARSGHDLVPVETVKGKG